MRARAATRLLLVIVAAALAFCAYVYASNVRLLERRYPVQPLALAAASGADAVARGKALADITGCTDCHRANLQGGTFVDEGWLRARYYASNLTRRARVYSDADIARVVRDGVRPDGHGVVSMPSFGYVRLTDAEMADILAFLRSMPEGGPEQPDHHLGPLEHWALWRGEFQPTVGYVASERRKHLPDAGAQHESGRHIVGIVCVECHGGDLKGHGWDGTAPDLRVVQAYDADAFRRLLRTGIGADGQEHGLMSRVARDRLHRLSDGEIAAVFGYLQARAARPG